MTFKLILKQSLNDFFKKILLYVSFTLFLVIAISLSVGLLTFSVGYNNIFTQSFGTPYNSTYNISYRFLPKWVNKEEVKNEIGYEHYLVQEKTDENLMQFLIETLDLNETEAINNKVDLESLLLLVGTLNETENGVRLLQPRDFINNKVLTSQIHQSADAIISRFNNPNEQISLPQLKTKLYEKHSTNYFLAAYFVNQFHQDSNLIWANPPWGFGGVGYHDEFLSSRWDFLHFSPNLINNSRGKQIYNETPWMLRKSETDSFKIWNQVNWNLSKYEKYLKNYNFTYVSPLFLHQNGLKIGDEITLNFKKNNSDNQGYQFLIAGSITTNSNFYRLSGSAFMLPYQWIKATINDQINLYFNHQFWRVISAGNNYQVAQNYLSQKISSVIEYVKNPEKPISKEVNWIQLNDLPVKAFAMSRSVFNVLAIAIGFLVLFLLFVVFFFITKEIIMLQRQTLIFLKALGVGNISLSLLTTCALLVPLLIAFIGGLFGSLGIQNMLFQIILDNSTIYWPFFTFNWSFFMILVLVIFIAATIFFMTNMLFIVNRITTSQQLTKVHGPAKIVMFSKQKVSAHVSPKLQIGISFALKNVGKNLITYLLLTIAFSVILYAVQFKVSLNSLSGIYEKWNAPYKSVVYNEQIPVFANEQESETPYLRSYETVVNENDELNAINNILDLKRVIANYKYKLGNPFFDFNWKKYYFTQGFTKEWLERIDNDPSAKQIIEQFLINEGLNEETVWASMNAVDYVVEVHALIKKEFGYNGGFNVFMGKTLLRDNALQNTRNVLSFRSNWITNDALFKVQAYEENDEATAKYFHFSPELKTEDFIVPITEFEPKVNIFSKALKVNVSKYLQSIYSIKVGQVLEVKLEGLNQHDMKSYFIINEIVKEDTIRPSVYTSQKGLFKYLMEMADFYRHETKSNPTTEIYNEAYQAYQNLFELKTLSNSVYDANDFFPWGFKNLTIPITKNVGQPKIFDANWLPGTRIEDFYSGNLQTYFESLKSNVMMFDIVTNSINNQAKPFILILNRFIIILSLLAFIISLILITLILLENRQVILLFKAMGYKHSEVNWYLISGYFISAILATFTAMLASFLILNFTKGPIAEYIGTSVYFVWTWQFIVLAFFLAGGFCGLIATSIVTFTNLQKPREAFAIL